MSLARKILSNTAWQVVGKIITAVLGIISVKLITNYLSTTQYGEYTTIYDYTALFAIIADFGLFTIAVREMANGRGEKAAVEKIVGNVLSIRTALAVISLLVGIAAAFLIPAYQDSFIPIGVMLVSAATILTLIAGTISSVLQFHLKMHWASIALTLGKLLTVLYIAAVIIWWFPDKPAAGFPHLFYGWIYGSLFAVAMTFVASNQLVSIRYRFDFAFWKSVLMKALPYGLALVLGTIYFRMGTIVLSLFRLKTDVGFYGVPIRFLEILQIIPHYFMNSVLPTLTMAVVAAQHERISKIVRLSLNALFALGAATFVGGFTLAWPITAAVSSSDYLSFRDAGGILHLGSDVALKILLAAMLGTYLHVVLSYALVAMNRQVEILWINGIVVVINIVLNLILAPRYGFIGAAIATAITEFFVLSMLFIRTRMRIFHILDFPFLLKTTLSALLMGLVLTSIKQPLHEWLFSLSLFLLIPIGALVFIGATLASGAINKETLSLLRKNELK